MPRFGSRLPLDLHFESGTVWGWIATMRDAQFQKGCPVNADITEAVGMTRLRRSLRVLGVSPGSTGYWCLSN
ncbi:MAG: hypothetical protein L0Y43_10725, partial [Methylococcaceae bacterium]|nr:hypothetical protein [Methylococcaceae bacterium]